MNRHATIAVLVLLCGPLARAATSPQACWSLHRHGQRAAADACFTQLTQSGDASARAEGFWGLEDWQNANESFRAATSNTSSPRTGQGAVGHAVP